jgi:Tol biopolymer transport system component
MKPAWVVALAAGAVSVASAATPGPARVGAAASRQAPGLIAFTTFRRSTSRLVVERPTDLSSRAIARAANQDVSPPAWSPDSRRVLYGLSAAGGLYVTTVATGGTRVITRARVGDAAWSPRGRWIAFVREVATGEAIFLIRPDGSSLHQVGADVADFEDLAWNPDGTLLAATELRRERGAAGGGGCTDVAVIALDGSSRSVSGDDCASAPASAPDGSRIAFVTTRADGTAIAVAPTAGADISIAASGHAERHPVWSPAGTEIAFSRLSADDGRREIATVRPDGSATRTITHPSVKADAPVSWSPDGGWILVERFDPIEDFGVADLFIVRRDGTALRRLYRTIDLGSASWSPR